MPFKFQANTCTRMLVGFCKKMFSKGQNVNVSSELAGTFPIEILFLSNIRIPNLTVHKTPAVVPFENLGLLG